MAFSTAAFAYVGVDITAATALEARPASLKPSPRGRSSCLCPSISVRFVATWTSFIIWIIYFVAGVMLSFNVHWDDPHLQRASFLGSPVNYNATDNKQISSDSGFTVSALLSQIPGLSQMFTVIIFVTVLFSANTNLYVASRSLFVLTRKIDGHEWYWRCLAFFGKTNSYQVPVRAMLLSCCLLWVPFLYLAPHSSATIASVSFLFPFGLSFLISSVVARYPFPNGLSQLHHRLDL